MFVSFLGPIFLVFLCHAMIFFTKFLMCWVLYVYDVLCWEGTFSAFKAGDQRVALRVNSARGAFQKQGRIFRTVGRREREGG